MVHVYLAARVLLNTTVLVVGADQVLTNQSVLSAQQTEMNR